MCYVRSEAEQEIRGLALWRDVFPSWPHKSVCQRVIAELKVRNIPQQMEQAFVLGTPVAGFRTASRTSVPTFPLRFTHQPSLERPREAPCVNVAYRMQEVCELPWNEPDKTYQTQAAQIHGQHKLTRATSVHRLADNDKGPPLSAIICVQS